jgi:hypothetical protein
MRYLTVKTSKTHYKFINVQQFKEDVQNTFFWVAIIGMFLYCLFA